VQIDYSLVRPIRTPCAPLSTRWLRVSVNGSPRAAQPFLEPSDEVSGGWYREDVWESCPPTYWSTSLSRRKPLDLPSSNGKRGHSTR